MTLPAHAPAAADHAPCILLVPSCIYHFAAKDPAHLIVCPQLGRIDTKQSPAIAGAF